MIRLAIQIVVLVVLGTALAKMGVLARNLPSWELAASPTEAKTLEKAKFTWKSELPKLRFVSASVYRHTLTKPIFFKYRRFPIRPKKHKIPIAARQPNLPQPVPPTPAPIISASTFKLLGIVVTPEGKRVLIETETVPASWYFPEDKINNWTINKIDENAAYLSLNGKQVTLKLYGQLSGN